MSTPSQQTLQAAHSKGDAKAGVNSPAPGLSNVQYRQKRDIRVQQAGNMLIAVHAPPKKPIQTQASKLLFSGSMTFLLDILEPVLQAQHGHASCQGMQVELSTAAVWRHTLIPEVALLDSHGKQLTGLHLQTGSQASRQAGSSEHGALPSPAGRLRSGPVVSALHPVHRPAWQKRRGCSFNRVQWARGCLHQLCCGLFVPAHCRTSAHGSM